MPALAEQPASQPLDHAPDPEPLDPPVDAPLSDWQPYIDKQWEQPRLPDSVEQTISVEATTAPENYSNQPRALGQDRKFSDIGVMYGAVLAVHGEDHPFLRANYLKHGRDKG